MSEFLTQNTQCPIFFKKYIYIIFRRSIDYVRWESGEEGPPKSTQEEKEKEEKEQDTSKRKGDSDSD